MTRYSSPPALTASSDEDGERNVVQTIGDGIAKGIEDGPDPGHHERAEHVEGSAYTLPPPVDEVDDEEDDVPEIDWPALKHEDFDNGCEMAHRTDHPSTGSSVALYATSKTGKSLLAFDIVAAAASGRPILGGDPLEEPIHILYVDQENTRREAWDRGNVSATSTRA